MEKLLEGIIKFKQNDFEKHKSLFKELKYSQNPHTLFIGCSDSRVVPNLITQTSPGELFVVRNIANRIPRYRKNRKYSESASAMEYAVNKLNVPNIIICGHSHCGGCKVLFSPKGVFKSKSRAKKSLGLGYHQNSRVLKEEPEDEYNHPERLIEQINVVEQMENLLTYPFIKVKYEEQSLVISGWYYICETGEVFIYNKESRYFELGN
ncbi:MAG: Carbonic anhydrase 1 [Candidatus Dichloromethanomonas elyunquensis]|nr:MAG: Carbonic anhydrase 1 [Candidatus Dichloromethanomonas elyunquensis]